jgi:hypothetical protein
VQDGGGDVERYVRDYHVGFIRKPHGKGVCSQHSNVFVAEESLLQPRSPIRVVLYRHHPPGRSGQLGASRVWASPFLCALRAILSAHPLRSPTRSALTSPAPRGERRATTRSIQPSPMLCDALALVRKELWATRTFLRVGRGDRDGKSPASVNGTLDPDALCYAA